MQAVIRFRDIADNQRLKKICDYFKLSGKSVKEQYCSRVLRAEQLFFYHPVYNPNSKDIAYFINPNISCSSCDDDRYKIRDECSLVGDLSIDTDDGDNRSSSYPLISMNELLKLGGTAQEVVRLLPQPHNSSNKQQHHSEDLSICNVKQSNSSSSSSICSSIAIKDVCEGVYYIKDHEYIQPNFPWHNLASNGLRSTCSNAAKSLRHELMRSVNHLHHVIQTQSDSKYVQKSLSFPSTLSTVMLTNMAQGVVSSSTCDNNQFAKSFNKPQSAHNIYTSSAQMNKAIPTASKRSYQEAFSTCIPTQPSTTSICVPQPSTSIGKKLDIFQSFKYCRQQQSDCTPNYRQSTVITMDTCKRHDEATIVTPSVDDVGDGGVVNRDDVSDHLSDVLLPSTVKKELPIECTVYDLTGDDTTHRTIEVAGRNDDLQIAVASDYPSVMLFDERQHGHWTGKFKLDDKENELQCQLSVYDLVVDSDRADNDDSAKHHDNTSAASSTVYITPDPSLRKSTTELLKTTKSLLNQTNNRIRIGTNIVTATKRKTMGLVKPPSFLANTSMGDSDHGDHLTDGDTLSSKLMTNIQQTQKMHIPSAKSIHHSSSNSSSSASPASNKNKRGRIDTLTRRGSLGGTASIRSFFQRVI